MSAHLQFLLGKKQGLQNIVLQKFNPEDFLKTIQDYKSKISQTIDGCSNIKENKALALQSTNTHRIICAPIN